MILRQSDRILYSHSISGGSVITIQPEFKPLAINADRICEGISKIGYRPTAAIMDIVDNSVAAGASSILIQLVLRAGAQATSSGSIESIRILDNGSGMSPTQMEQALEIGANMPYDENSLSKFGMGLKSAGFSLGRRITVFSKLDASFAARYVDRDVIRERNQYGVCVDNEAVEPEWLRSLKHGTIVEISKTPERQDSAARCARDLRNKLGVTYCYFLASSDSPLSISLQVGKREPEPIESRDILYLDDAVLNFDADNYDASLPCVVYNGTVGDDLLMGQEKIQLTISLFPRDNMKVYPGFTDAQKRRVDGYDIKRENSGFYFYRNGRLIRWGDKLDISSRDDINFRARVSFTTVHDEYFNVDVSKQNLELSEDFLNKLKALCRTPLKSAREIMDRCTAMLNQGVGDEGASFNERTEVFPEDDPMEVVGEARPELASARRRLREQLTRAEEQIEEAEASPQEERSLEDQPQAFQRMRYTDSMMGLDLAVAGFDAINGTYVRINRSHPFYQLVLAHFEPQSAERMALEALLWSSAVAESKTFENLPLEPAQINTVLTHLRRVFSATTGAWAESNQDIFN